MNISVVVPVYNSEASLKPFVERLAPVLEGLADAYELILVNDGSRDNSREVVAELDASHAWIHGVDLMRNYGQHNALLCGIRRAQYEVIVTMDDDLQHPPEEIHKLIDKLDEGFDVVYGPPERRTHSLLRSLATSLTKVALRSAMGIQAAGNVSAFRVFRTPIRNAFEGYRSPFVSIDVLLTWGTTRFSSIRVRHDVREIGKSNYTARKLATHAMNLMTGFSTLPLQIASVVGFFFTLFGLLVLLFVIGRVVIQGIAFPGFAFQACIIAIFAGAQLFALGIIGEYLARMHFRTMERPAYVIREDPTQDDSRPAP